ncbi:helix-turn-helix domain-containing protein [Nostoc sp. 'Peltigera membranacea cyanobiont' N6]|uniref:helix-turn-helix domain-containing protein n=1 Tax=Nostoc sp. 'Peltigera membranacea cyanobiont' N6 TaxID=1261031 RepID=UPI000CF34A75|nr:helix-turn-helix transcriptional regulator [Nostoc sp. 'Peltigera membranacea cyanobiont' N6]AVH64048.1 XRE family transcriptional regulator [Nostoc sp. 'Peltigera membranacea cyanobiont' N6]
MVRKTLTRNQPEVGKFLRELRILAGLTQEQFASFLGVTYSTINRWENGHTRPMPLAMQKIEEIAKDMGEQGEKLIVKYYLK